MSQSKANVHAVNQEFTKYDQVTKNHTYHLAEEAADEFDSEYEIKTFDFEPFLRGDAKAKARFAEEFGAAVQDIGFSHLGWSRH